MPTYEYACLKCGAAFDLFQLMKDDAITVCPKDRCPKARWGKGKVQRQMGTGAGLIFKGSGFYTTDYRSEGYKAAAKKDSQGATPAPATPAKTETPSAKPAASTPSASPSTPKPKPSDT